MISRRLSPSCWSCLRFRPIRRGSGGRSQIFRLWSWTIITLWCKSGILATISIWLSLINAWFNYLITIWCRRGRGKNYNIFTYILAILRRSRWCYQCSIRCLANIGCIGNTSYNTRNWDISRSNMFELMSSTLKRNIDDIVADFIRTTKLASVHNTLWDWWLWLKEPLEIHFIKCLFSHINYASAGAYLDCPLFDSCDIRLNVGRNLYHLDVRCDNRAFRVNIQKWLIELRVWERFVDAVEVDRVEEVGDERGSNIISRPQLDGLFVTNDISYTNFVRRIDRHRVFLNFHILPIHNCYRSVVSGS